MKLISPSQQATRETVFLIFLYFYICFTLISAEKYMEINPHTKAKAMLSTAKCHSTVVVGAPLLMLILMRYIFSYTSHGMIQPSQVKMLFMHLAASLIRYKTGNWQMSLWGGRGGRGVVHLAFNTPHKKRIKCEVIGNPNFRIVTCLRVNKIKWNLLQFLIDQKCPAKLIFSHNCFPGWWIYESCFIGQIFEQKVSSQSFNSHARAPQQLKDV